MDYDRFGLEASDASGAGIVDYEGWANPGALHVFYVMHPDAECSRVNQCSDPRDISFLTFAARDLSNIARTLVALHPDVAADLLIYHSGGLADGCFGGEAKALLLAAEDVGVDLLAMARADTLNRENR